MNTTLATLATLPNNRPGYGATLADVLAVPTPERTRTYTPVSYGDYLTALASSLSTHGAAITRADYALAKEGANLFGTFTLANPADDDWAMTLGFRTGNAHDMSLWIAVGSHVFVCSNGCFFGEFKARVIHRGSALSRVFSMADTAVTRALYGRERMTRYIDSWKAREISDMEAQATILEAGARGAMPSSKLLPVWNEYQHPQHEEFQPRTAWSLQNAFTEIQKTRSAVTTHQDTQTLNRLFVERYAA